MTFNEKSADGTAREAPPWTGSSETRSNHVRTPPLNSQQRIQGIGIAATGVAATIWLVGAVWAWQVIG